MPTNVGSTTCAASADAALRRMVLMTTLGAPTLYSQRFDFIEPRPVMKVNRTRG
jgi:hypothetical protein